MKQFIGYTMKDGVRHRRILISRFTLDFTSAKHILGLRPL